MKAISVPARLWYDNTERVLNFPVRWDVINLTSPGLDKPGLTPGQIKNLIENPIDGATLVELAKDNEGVGVRLRRTALQPPNSRFSAAAYEKTHCS